MRKNVHFYDVEPEFEKVVKAREIRAFIVFCLSGTDGIMGHFHLDQDGRVCDREIKGAPKELFMREFYKALSDLGVEGLIYEQPEQDGHPATLEFAIKE